MGKTSQTDKLIALLKSTFAWTDTPTILEHVYGADHLGVARIAARVDDAKKKIGPQYRIESRRKPGSETVWQYRISPMEQRPDGELFPPRLGVSREGVA